MPTVANLAVSVSARTGDFNRKMQESAGVVRRFGRVVVGITRRLITFNSAMRLVKLVGVTLATRYALKFADAIVVTARKVGLANNELIGLQFAAGLAGIKISDLTKHLERMAPKLGTIRDALKGMGIQGSDLALMVEVIGQLGLSMSQLQGKAVQDAVAAVRRLWTVIKAVSLELAVRLAPAVKWVANELLHFVVMARLAMVELATRLQPYIDSAAERLMQFATAGANAGMVMPRSFGLIAEAGAKLANAIVFIEAAWHGLNAAVLTVSANMVKGFDTVLGAVRILIMELAQGARALGQILPIPKKQLDAMNEAIDGFQRGVARSQKAIAGLAIAMEADAAVAIEKMNAAWDKFAAGKAGEDFKAAFADIAERAAEIVAQILKLQKIGLTIPEIPSAGALGAAARARRTEFKQISLSRTAVQGINVQRREQLVHDPQLARTNDLLDRIRFALTLPGVGLTS